MGWKKLTLAASSIKNKKILKSHAPEAQLVDPRGSANPRLISTDLWDTSMSVSPSIHLSEVSQAVPATRPIYTKYLRRTRKHVKSGA
jgi:hypothetical protein